MRQIAVMLGLLMYTDVCDGGRRLGDYGVFIEEVFECNERGLFAQSLLSEAVVRYIEGPHFLDHMCNFCNMYRFRGRGPWACMREVFQWLTEEHPQTAVRAAVSDVLRVAAEDSDSDSY